MQVRPVSCCTRADLLRVRPAVRERDLDLDVLARAHRGDGLRGVQLGRGAQDDRVHVVAGEDLVRGRSWRAPTPYLRATSLGLLQPAADDGRDGDAVDQREGVQVLDAEGAGPGECDPHRSSSFRTRTCQDRAAGHEVPDRGVGPGDVVEAVQLLDLGPMAPRMISCMTSSIPSEPASRTYSMCGTERQVVRVVDQPVEERVVELGVDEPGARPLQLMAHAAGAPDLHGQVLAEALPRPGGWPCPACSSGARSAAGTARRSPPAG